MRTSLLFDFMFGELYLHLQVVFLKLVHLSSGMRHRIWEKSLYSMISPPFYSILVLVTNVFQFMGHASLLSIG
jgi:hypothetical protein